MVQGCHELPVISNIAIEACSDGDRTSCLGGQPSDLCSLLSLSSVMPDNDKKAVTTIECCDNADAFVSKSGFNINVMEVVTLQSSAADDMSSSLGVLLVSNVINTSNRN